MEPHVNVSVVIRSWRVWFCVGWYGMDPWKLFELRVLDSGFGYGVDVLMLQVLKFSVGCGVLEWGDL